MLITEEIFQAFLKCETKAHLKFTDADVAHPEIIDWRQGLIESYNRECYVNLRSGLRDDEYLVGALSPQDYKNNTLRLLIDCVIQGQGLKSRIHALERLSSSENIKRNPFIPIRFVPREKITQHDKLLLAFDALILSIAVGKAPPFGRIIYGHKQTAVKIRLDALMKTVRSVVDKILARQASPPPLVLNRHCTECEFRARCRKIAVERDELSLLSGMSEKERMRQHSKGIFSITQFSYTFRARRKPKRFASKQDKYSHSLRALAIRESKIHITGKPELIVKGTPVYLDVEGIPDRDSYYLIGLRVKSGDSYAQHSFWANDPSEEKEIWVRFLQALTEIESPQLIHYGSYETLFLKHMKERHSGDVDDPEFLDKLIAESVNILSVIYAQIYFPTYSNGLKDLAQYLGFHWSDSNASGFNSLVWRSEWELSKQSSLKEKLITYNAEDCEALERVAHTIIQLCQRQNEAPTSKDNNVVDTELLKQENSYHLGKFDPSLPEFEYINKAAYWDYQREKVYVRSSQRLKRVSRKSAKGRAKALPISKIVECPAPPCCFICEAMEVHKYRRLSKIVYDLKFGRTGVKRWIVKFVYQRYRCGQCGATFLSEEQKAWTKQKYGPNIRAYLMYLIVELKVSQHLATQSLNDLFGFRLLGRSNSIVTHQKAIACQMYESTYEGILNKMATGKLVHADETQISIRGRSAYVWVFTNLEEVAYHYTETREGDFLQELLREFKGVLVSDFYAAYDSMNCYQQKCLIHLMRDLNDDLLKQPFNEEMKELVREFAVLLKPIIETVDRFGLKARFLRKHKVFVEHFYKRLSKRNYESEIVIKYRKRFDKYRDKLFTFLDYDDVPWNNNNAEHAIKAFATLRRKIGEGSSDKGIREYLILLSISETCKYQGISFLDFLRSGQTSIDEFIGNSRCPKRRDH